MTRPFVVVVSSIEWEFLWQGHQEIASRYAADGSTVLYIENTGTRRPRLADLPRITGRLRAWITSRSPAGHRVLPRGVHVVSPLVLPPYSGAVAARVNRWLLRRTVLRVAAQVGGARPLVWTFLPTDTAVTIIDELDPCGVVYWCLTDFAVITPQRAALAESERALLARTDVVFAQYEQLAADLRRQHGNVHVVPFGVDLAAFRTDAARERPAAAQPVIGYVGGLHWHVDLELVARAARLRPGWRFVFVGSEHTNVDALRREPNIELRGMRPHEELVEHILGFDVCIVPYVLSEYTATVVPTKINEYLAVGRPVVSTPMPAVLDFQAEHQVLELANPRAEDFVAAIERALETADDPDAVERRRRVAALSDWSARFAGMNQVIDEAIGPVR